MLAFLQQNYMPVLIIGGILAIVLFTICIIRKFVRLAIGIAILSVIILILFTIFWGDGSAYISELASYLAPNHQQQLEEAYAYYKEQDSKDPIINSDAVSDKITDVFDSIKETEQEVTDETVDYVKERVDEWLRQAPIQKTEEADPG